MTLTRWTTLASDTASLSFVSLVDSGELRILVDGLDGTQCERFAFVFRKFFGFRSLREEYRTKLWSADATTASLGWTRQVANSIWLAELRDEPLFLLHGGDQAIHYMLCTEDEVIEVVAKTAPDILSLGYVD